MSKLNVFVNCNIKLHSQSNTTDHTTTSYSQMLTVCIVRKPTWQFVTQSKVKSCYTQMLSAINIW